MEMVTLPFPTVKELWSFRLAIEAMSLRLNSGIRHLYVHEKTNRLNFLSQNTALNWLSWTQRECNIGVALVLANPVYITLIAACAGRRVRMQNPNSLPIHLWTAASENWHGVHADTSIQQS